MDIANLQGETVMDDLKTNICEDCVAHGCHFDVLKNGVYVDNCTDCAMNTWQMTAQTAEQIYGK